MTNRFFDRAQWPVTALAVLTILGDAIPAFAQNAATPEQVNPAPGPNAPQNPQSQMPQNNPRAAPSDRNEQLSRSPSGVIPPPATGDWNVVQPRVDPNSTPVIPPLGSPQNDPEVQPK